MTIALALAAAVSIGLPLFWIWRLACLQEPSRLRWLVKSSGLLAGVAFVLLVSRWGVVGIHSRTALLVLVVAATVFSFSRHADRPWRVAGRWAHTDRWSTLGSLALMLGLAGTAAAGLLPPSAARPLACPFDDGRFIIGQGGGNILVNRHVGHRAQSHAVDILALGPFGFRANGLLPRELGRYAIFDAAVVSPCRGRVAATQGGLPDLTPPEVDPEHAAGNHVVIVCGDLSVMLAHLSAGSITVTPDQAVSVGTPIGRVGNSGNTTEPHLHVHATDAGGRAVPVTLGGINPVRGRILDCGQPVVSEF